MAAALLAAVAAGCGGRASEAPRAPDGVALERVSFATFDGARVPGLFARPAAARVRGRPCVVALGGLRGRKERLVPVMAAAAQAGMPVLAIDARAHGERGSPAQVDAIVRSAPRLARLVRETALDLRRALDHLQARPECDPRRLGLLGSSLGGLTGVVAAGSDRRVRATAILVAAAGWREIFHAHDLFLPRVEDDEQALDAAVAQLAPYEPARWIARIAPRPVLIVNGRADQYVPVADAERLQAAARAPKEVLWYEGDHAWTGNAEVLPAVVAFLRRTLVQAR